MRDCVSSRNIIQGEMINPAVFWVLILQGYMVYVQSLTLIEALADRSQLQHIKTTAPWHIRTKTSYATCRRWSTNADEP